MADITPARKLFDLLISRDFDPEMLDSSGRPAPDPAEAEIFSFDFRARSGKDYGTVVIMLGNDNDLEIYCSDNVGRGMEGDDKNDWFAFLEQLKNFATRNFMSFGIKNLNRLRYSMQGQAAIKEGLFESWTGNRTTSWNGAATEARLMIRHKKTIGEGDARFRHIESLFIETADSERYKLPFTSLTAGRAMLEHVRQGGRPYDARGNHISEMVTELAVLSRFRRANSGQIFEGDTAQLVEQVQQYQSNLQRSLKGLGTKHGYTKYFESWQPADISEQDVVIESLKNLFVKQSIDTRIESALPLLAKIQQQGTAMKEANIFEAWAERLVEGTWQTPDTPEKQAQLLELMSTDLPVGADATNVTEQLYDLLGDDELFDQLEALAERDANADARQVIFDRMQELSDDPDVRKVIEQLNIDPTAEMNPAEPTNPADLSEEELDELTRRDFLRGAGAALGGAALAGVAGQAQAAAPGSSKPTAVSNVYSLEKVMTIRAICQAEARGHRRVAGDKPDAFDLTVQKPPYFTGWFDPATIAKAEKVSVNALTNFSRKINPAEYKEYLELQSEAYRRVDVAYRSFADKDKKSAAKSMAFYEPIYKSLVQNAEQLANKLNEYTAVTYGQKTGLEESRLMDAAGETIDHILNRFKHEVKKFEQNGDLDDDLYEALFDYYSDAGEIPYGIAKARDGDPMEWVAQNLQSHLSGGGIVGGNPDEDYGIERESVMHGDYAEEKNAMRRLAGMAPEAVQEPHSVDGGMENPLIQGEGAVGAVLGGVAGAALGGPIGAVRGAMAGDAIGDAISPDQTDENDASLFDDATCNMTEAGESCPVHGVEECYGADTSPLAGQYGHSGKMKAVAKDLSFLDRLKELSGLKR